MLQGNKNRLQWLKQYFKTNPGALFIVAFQILLVSAGVLLASGNSAAANEAANYAFYSLVIGVAMYAAQLIREERRRTRTGSADPSEAS